MFLEHAGSGLKFPLHEGQHLIGRGPTATIRFSIPDISREHAFLSVENGRAVLEDLQSTNGTRINGERIGGPARLEDGARLTFGRLELEFRAK